MTTVLIFDTETSGKPDFKLPADDPSQPHICEVGALLMTGPDEVVGRISTLIKPEGWEIDAETEAIHGISTAMCRKEGQPASNVIGVLARMIDEADIVAGFNVDFDLKMVRGALRRLGMDDRYDVVKDKKFDVMRACKPLCKIPATNRMRKYNFRGYKLPRLEEACEMLLGRQMQGAHRAMADAAVTAELYWHLNGYDFGNLTVPDVVAERRAEARPPEPQDDARDGDLDII